MSIDDGGSGGITALLDAPTPPPAPAPTTDKRKRLLVILGIIAGLLAIVAAVLFWYLLTHKPLSQIPILGHETMPTYQSSIYGADRPLGVAVSPDGQRIYVTESGAKRDVAAFDTTTGKKVVTFKAPTDRPKGSAYTPIYVAVSPRDGSVYVTDNMADRVYVYTSGGTYQRTVKPIGLTGTWVPLAIAIDASGNVYITETGGKDAHRVVVLDPTDKVLRTLAPKDSPMLFPNGVAVDKDGNVFVSDSNNGRMLAFNSNGDVIGGAKRGVGDGDLGLPRGIATDGGDRTYVVDTTNQTVKAYKLNGDGSNRVLSIGSFGDEGIGEGLFEYPNGISIDSQSHIFVTDRANNRIQVWSL